jgi:hypothetical protein
MKAAGYFPPSAVNGFGNYFSSDLSFAGEPSLLAAAQDSLSISYRVDWSSSQRG